MKTTSSLTLDAGAISYIDTNETQLLANVNTLNSKIGANDKSVRELIDGKQHGMKSRIIIADSHTTKSTKFTITSMTSINAYIVYFSVMGSIISAPYHMIKAKTSLAFASRSGGKDCQRFIEISGSNLYIEVGEAGHEVTNIYIVY